MKLILIRHGEAVRELGNTDPSLSAAGIQNIEKLAQALEKRVEGGRIVHSRKKRAKETAEILQKNLSANLFIEEHVSLSPNDPVEMILNDILSETEDLIIVSHLPFLPSLMERLNVHIVNFQPGTAVGLSPHWKIDWVL